MTKAQLEEKIKELELEISKQKEIIKNQEHLASAVDAKDMEISELKSKHRTEIIELKKQHQNDLSNLVDKHQKEIENISSSFENKNKNAVSESKKYAENVAAMLNERNRQLSEMIMNHGNLLKGLQGFLDTAIVLNEHFVKGVQK